MVVLLAPTALIPVTYPAFRLADAALDDAFGGQLPWFVGMSFYWAVWGFGFSVWVLGRRRAWELIRPRSATPQALRHVALFIALAAAVRFLVPGMEYIKATTGAAVLLAISAFANGVFEELLWRGVFLSSFPTSIWLRVVWPSLMFGLWHLVPGSISEGGPQIAMVVGPTLMGFYLA
ncbi:MAG: CPBP family intramembrane metalloprotease, partial [Acidimicrobiia bacterium]|nr:CPBP family intramembrane metalloprotease [Acidimicrobiia bacterium]